MPPRWKDSGASSIGARETAMKIAVGICTFRNPDGLQRLLAGIDRQVLHTISDESIVIVVVDNDEEESARKVLDVYSESGRFRLVAVHQLTRGLSTARNTVLDMAVVRDSDALAFIDDDEVPSVGWLEALTAGFTSASGAIIVGPVKPVFDHPPAAWLISGEFFQKGCKESGEVNFGYTSNVMLPLAVVRATGIRFDTALNQVGGEDAFFFEQLQMRGVKIICSPEAVVHENIPSNRASLSWLLRRWLRSGVTSAIVRSDSMSAPYAAMLNLSGGIGRIVAGSVVSFIVAITHIHKDRAAVIKSLVTVCRGCGMLMVAFGGTYEEYGRAYRMKAK